MQKDIEWSMTPFFFTNRPTERGKRAKEGNRPYKEPLEGAFFRPAPSPTFSLESERSSGLHRPGAPSSPPVSSGRAPTKYGNEVCVFFSSPESSPGSVREPGEPHTPDAIRTHDPKLRRLVLYPAELPALCVKRWRILPAMRAFCKPKMHEKTINRSQ